MRSVRSVFGSRQQNASSKSLSALEQPEALRQAMDAAAQIMNDDVDAAEAELHQGNSPFHKLGHGVVSFLRATLGFEQDVMKMASERLAEAESSASDAQRRAQRDPQAYRSTIYPAGSEYALCHAQSQLMSAVVAVLNESLTESIKGFYKLRKAFATLQEISEAEKRYLRSKSSSSIVTASSASSAGTYTPASAGNGTPRGLDSSQETRATTLTAESLSNGLADDDDDDFDFVDAEEKPTENSALSAYSGHVESLNLSGLSIKENGQVPEPLPPPDRQATVAAEPELDLSEFTNHPIDLFIHSGSNLCFGILQLMLSMIPPAFGKLLFIIGFKGDRDAGLKMLWQATKYNDINGAMAGLITLGFHNGAIAFCDILTRDAMPEARLRALLSEMRAKYPRSRLWLLEEARMHAGDRQLEKAVAMTDDCEKSPLRQVEALQLFEKSLNCMYLHRYEDSALSFLRCVELNNWSHALYYYIAGASYVELYRSAKMCGDTEAAAKHAKRATELLQVTVREHAGKKRFMARQLPFDLFITRKVSKWEQRSKDWDIDFIDAVGVSPIEEMCYFWNGYKRMRPEHLQTSLERLAWTEQQPTWEKESLDEKCILYLLRAAVARFVGNTTEAKSILEEQLLYHSRTDITGTFHDSWPLPVAHYEMAVCLFQDAGGEGGDIALLTRCSEWLEKVANWGSFDLDARIGLKITTARDTLRKCGVTPA